MEFSLRREHVRRSRDSLGCLSFVVDVREISKNWVRGQRYRLESSPGMAEDPRVDPVLCLGTYLLLRGERPGYLFGATHRDWSAVLFMDETKKMDADTFLRRFRETLCMALVVSAEWMGTHSFKRGGLQLLKQLGVEDAAIKERGRWSTMAAYIAYLAVWNRLEERFVYSSPMAAIVDFVQHGGARRGTEIHALMAETFGKMEKCFPRLVHRLHASRRA